MSAISVTQLLNSAKPDTKGAQITVLGLHGN